MFSVLREEFASLFQTFSRSDPPGKAPLTRGRYVFQKKRSTQTFNAQARQLKGFCIPSLPLDGPGGVVIFQLGSRGDARALDALERRLERDLGLQEPKLAAQLPNMAVHQITAV